MWVRVIVRELEVRDVEPRPDSEPEVPLAAPPPDWPREVVELTIPEVEPEICDPDWLGIETYSTRTTDEPEPDRPPPPCRVVVPEPEAL